MESGEMKTPSHIRIRGGCVHNLKNIDVDVPLHKIVGIAGVSVLLNPAATHLSQIIFP